MAISALGESNFSVRLLLSCIDTDRLGYERTRRRGIHSWAQVDSLDMQLDGAKVVLYRATTKIYFDVEN